MAVSKTGGSLKAVFDPARKAAAAAVMEPLEAHARPTTASRNRKAGGRAVRVSGYIPEEINEALRDEVVRRTTAERRSVSFNDVLCDILEAWRLTQISEGGAAP